ncbi:hypothetical protein Dimus_017311 [Dionaea muscipula]
MCHVSNSHLVLARIDLELWVIEIFDSLGHLTPDNPKYRENQFNGMTQLPHVLLAHGNNFPLANKPMNTDLFKAIRIVPEEIGEQTNASSQIETTIRMALNGSVFIGLFASGK